MLGKRDYVSLNTSYSVLHADGGLTGTFSGLTWGPAVLLGEGQLHYGANDANVTLQRLDVNAAARALGIVDTVAQASARRVEQAFREIDIQQAQGRGQLSTSFMAAAAACNSLGAHKWHRLRCIVCPVKGMLRQRRPALMLLMRDDAALPPVWVSAHWANVR